MCLSLHLRCLAFFVQQWLLMALMLRCGDRWHAAVVAAVVRAAFAAVVSLLRDFCVTIFHHVSTFFQFHFQRI